MKYSITRYGHTWDILVADDNLEKDYREGNLCEHHMLDWIMANVPRGGVWIDAGANIGNHALPFSLRADLVICFEPMPQNYALLDANTRAVRNVMRLMVGVGNKPCLMAAQPGGSGKPSQWALRDGEGVGTISVVTIDQTIPPGMEVRLIKLDVEGMEPQAIAGALDTIGRWRPEIFVEIWEAAVLDRIRAVLATLGYKLIERWNHAPTYHFSASGRYPVTYTPPVA